MELEKRAGSERRVEAARSPGGYFTGMAPYAGSATKTISFLYRSARESHETARPIRDVRSGDRARRMPRKRQDCPTTSATTLHPAKAGALHAGMTHKDVPAHRAVYRQRYSCGRDCLHKRIE
jgi:hypothetical protein